MLVQLSSDFILNTKYAFDPITIEIPLFLAGKDLRNNTNDVKIFSKL